MKITPPQREIIMGLFTGRELVRLYGSMSGVRYYLGTERVAERTVKALEQKKLIKQGPTIKTGILMHKHLYELTDSGRKECT